MRLVRVRYGKNWVPVLSIYCLFFFLAVRVSCIGAEVGVEEKLGQRVPTDLVFNDESGASVTLQSLLGKPTVLTLVYYECPGICTPLLNNLVGTLDQLDMTAGKDFQVLTISFDSKDTAALAAKKRANYLKQFTRPFPAEGWRFLTGDQEAITKITDAVGFHYKKIGEDFNHPGVIIILSPDGRVMRYLQGISFLPFDIKMAAIEASKGHPMPTVNRMLAFCFSYDPEGRKYVFATLRVAGSVMVFVLTLFVAWLLISTRRYRKGMATHGN